MKQATHPVCADAQPVKFTARQVSAFWEKLNKIGPLPDQSNPHYAGLTRCWQWTRAMHTSGYGAIRRGTKIIKSHRVAWLLSGNEIPSKMCVLHRCDNRRCCNPDHLFLGTLSENTADRHKKGRSKGPRGEKNVRFLRPELTARGERQGNARLTDEKVREIRQRYQFGVIGAQKLAKEFGVGKSTIRRVINNTHWRHITSEKSAEGLPVGE
jgi:hypothetical protein